MNQLTEEQKQRLREIRIWRLGVARATVDQKPWLDTIDFFLSLNEQLLAEHERLNAIVSAYENEDEEALAEAYKL